MRAQHGVNANTFFLGYGQFFLTHDSVTHYPEQVLQTFIIQISGNVQWAFPIIEPDCEYAEVR